MGVILRWFWLAKLKLNLLNTPDRKYRSNVIYWSFAIESEYGTPNIFKDTVTIINIRLWIRDENNYNLVKFWFFRRIFAIFQYFVVWKVFLVKSQFLIQRSISKRSSLKGVNVICTILFVRVRFSNMYVFVKLPFWSDFKGRVDSK